MLSICDGLRFSYIPGINEISYKLPEGLNSWLSSGKMYLPASDIIDNQFTISTYEYLDFLTPFVYEINRLSCASLETINNITKDSISPKFLGWLLVKYYYSAFFSAHSILRICGHGILNVDPNSLNQIKRLANNYGYNSSNISSGLYCIEINQLNNKYKFYKDDKYDNSHEGLWLRFLHFLNQTSPLIYNHLPSYDAYEIISKLDELVTAITNNGAIKGNWLSKIRNLINYSHAYNVWYPYKGYSKELDNIFPYQSLCKGNPLNIELESFKRKDLLYFVRTCQLINSINFDLLKDLKDRHPQNKSFVLKGIIGYHNLYNKPSEFNTGLIH